MAVQQVIVLNRAMAQLNKYALHIYTLLAYSVKYVIAQQNFDLAA